MPTKLTLYLILLLELLLFGLFRWNSDGEMLSNLFAGLLLYLMLFNGLIIALTLSRRVAAKLTSLIDLLAFIHLVVFLIVVALPLVFAVLVRVA